MTTEEALEALGVRDDTLMAEEKRRLDEDGYLLLSDVLMPALVTRMRDTLDAIAAEGADAGTEYQQEEGTVRVGDLINKDPDFDVTFTHPRVLAAVRHIIDGPFLASSVSGRSALPGAGHQKLHVDGALPPAPGQYVVANSIWLLDPFTAENGATWIVPGSRRSGKPRQDVREDARAPHPDEVRLIAPSGTVVVFNAHVWHGGTINRTNQLRRGIFAFFIHRDLDRKLDTRATYHPKTRARLSEAERYILDA